MSTIDFDSWMERYIDPKEYEEILALYEGILSVTDGDPVRGLWNISVGKGGQVFVKQGEGETLVLVSQNAVETFRSMLDKRYSGGMGVEAWAASQRAADNTP